MTSLTKLIVLLAFLAPLYSVGQQPPASSDELIEKEPNQRRDLSIPGSRLVINPYDFGVSAKKVTPYQYSTSAEMPLHVAYLSTGNAYKEKQRMGRVFRQVLALWKQHEGQRQAATGLSVAWTPHALPFTADYNGNTHVKGYDFFYNDEVLVRKIEAAKGEALTVGGLIPETVALDAAKQVLVVRSLNVHYAIAFNTTIPAIQYYRTEEDLKKRQHPQPQPVKGGWWAIDFSALRSLETAVAFAPPQTTDAEVIAQAKNAVQKGAAQGAYTARKNYWNNFLKNKVPHPHNFSLSMIDPKGVSPEDIRLSYYRAWVCLAQNVLPPDAAVYPYYQLVTGKASLWDEGEPKAPFSATWESFVALQLYAHIDPAVSWSALKGLLSLVDEEGMLGGESLPSRKAQSAWLLYQFTNDKASLKEVYPALKRYTNWRRVQPRWIYKSETPENEKDAEFVVSALVDMKCMRDIAGVLGLEEDQQWWESQRAQLFGDYTTWFWKTPDSLPVQHINHRKGRDTYPIQITTGLYVDQLQGAHHASMMRLFNHYYDTTKSFAGFNAPKYPDMDYTIYGLVGKGETEKAKVLIEANIRDVIRADCFAETYFHDATPVPGGVRPSIFGMAQVASFVLLKNGYVFDKGEPHVVNLYGQPTGVTGIHYRQQVLDIKMEPKARKAQVFQKGKLLKEVPVEADTIKPVFTNQSR
jgi:hypothetical protein